MAKKSNNDKIILDLKTKIEAKKAQLKAVEKFVPKTNCSLLIDGERFNLHASDSASLTLLLIKLNSLRLSAEDLKMEAPAEISGYKIADWISDCKSKLTITNKQKEEARLKALETQLHNLLSAETKTELLINELESMI